MEQEYYNSEYLSELLESPKTSDFYFRQEQLKVFLSNSIDKTSDIKPYLAAIVAANMSILQFLKNNEVTLSEVLEQDSTLNEQDKISLIKFEKDLSYLKPVGGPIDYVREIFPESIDTFILWFIIIRSIASSLGKTFNFTTKALMDLQQIKRNDLEIRLRKIELKEKDSKNEKK